MGRVTRIRGTPSSSCSKPSNGSRLRSRTEHNAQKISGRHRSGRSWRRRAKFQCSLPVQPSGTASAMMRTRGGEARGGFAHPEVPSAKASGRAAKQRQDRRRRRIVVRHGARGKSWSGGGTCISTGMGKTWTDFAAFLSWPIRAEYLRMQRL